jgi:hypothetical protein
MTFHAADGRSNFIRACIWCRVSGLMRFLDESDSESASNVVQISDEVQRTETLAVIRQAFGEQSVSRTRVFERKIPNSLRPKKARQAKSNQENVRHFL